MQKIYFRFLTKHIRTLILLPTLLLLMSQPGKAQWGGYHQFASDWELNANVGMTSFYGDLTDKKNRIFTNTPFHRYFYQDRGLGYSILLKKNVNSYFSVRGSFLHGKIYSHASNFDLYFDAVVNEYYIGADLDISTLIWGESRNRDWKFYGFLGIGFTDSRTWLYDDKTNQLVGTNGFGKDRWFSDKSRMATETTIPFGLGVSYRFHDNWTVNFETGIHGMNTDRLDAFKSKESGTEGFGYTSLGISYHFHMPWELSLRRYPKYNGKSTDPAIEQYNKRKRVIMNTKAYRKANKKRYRHPNDRNFIQKVIDWFKPKRYKPRRR